MIRIYSLKDLRAAYLATHPDAEIAEPKVRKERDRKCRKCGAVLDHKVGTNVWVCHNQVEVPDPTKENPDQTKMIPCGNVVLGH